MEPWIVSSPPSERYPLWTRANVGEVFPDPVAPLTFSLMMRGSAEPGWRDAGQHGRLHAGRVLGR